MKLDPNWPWESYVLGCASVLMLSLATCDIRGDQLANQLCVDSGFDQAAGNLIFSGLDVSCVTLHTRVAEEHR